MTKRFWTEEEVKYLREKVGVIKVSSIARRLNRSEQAVLIKMKRLGLSNTKLQTGYLTTHEIGKYINADGTTIRRWIKEHGLKSTLRVTCCVKKYHLIDPKDFWDWAELNKDRLNFAAIETHSIVPEPEWVSEERTKATIITNYKTWTTKEEKTLLWLFDKGYSPKEVAKQLNRTEYSIKGKYKRLISQ